MALDRILIHTSDGRRIPLEPSEIYYLEADGDDTLVRLRGKRMLRDVRRLGELEELLRDHHLIRVHRNYIINLRRIREIRPRNDGNDWAVRMEPPVNRIIPIGRTYESSLWKAFEA